MSTEAMKQALEALDIGLEYAESELYENRRRYEGYMHLAPDDQAYVNQIKEAITSLRQAIEQAEKNDLERLRDENERLHIENRRLIDRIEVMGVPVGVGGYLTTTTTPQPQQAEKQEPVAFNAGVPPLYPEMKDGETISVEYTTPPAAPVQKPMHPEIKKLYEDFFDKHFAETQREWVGLTDEEINNCDPQEDCWGLHEVARAIEAKLKEKNT